MDVVWSADGPIGAADIIAALDGQRDWSAKTIRSMLARLVAKDALAADPDGRRYLYRPLVTRDAHQRSAVRSLSSRLFKGRAAPLLSFLAEDDGLSDEDIAEIEALIEKLKS